ncbi:MAG: hypothetical protein HQL26_08405 [Candidatus Omnitrophica bacterium]|nr:hypothetical protein [Candidatus Omnitrophota bacterium]
MNSFFTFNSYGKRVIAAFLTWAFIMSTVFTGTGYAQLHALSIVEGPVSSTMLMPTPAFHPAIIKGVNIDPQDPLKFNFIIDKGTDNNPSSGRERDPEEFKQESTRLIKYFLASLTVPQDQMWVNLSPNEPDRMIPVNFGKTEMGRDVLAQDYLLKQLTASLMYPENELGRKFWSKIYERAQNELHTTDIPLDTYNKVWIIPETAKIYEHSKGAFIVSTHLKVMLEQDYVSLSKHEGVIKKGISKMGDDLKAQFLRQIIIPEIEKEVNEGEIFANLRQIYNSMILALWYKQALKKSILGQVFVDRKKTAGLETADPAANQKIYDQYLKAFQKGVYNYIKEEYNPQTQQIVSRKYFSGGWAGNQAGLAVENRANPELDAAMDSTDKAVVVQVKLQADAAMMSNSSGTNDTLSADANYQAVVSLIDQYFMGGLGSSKMRIKPSDERYQFLDPEEDLKKEGMSLYFLEGLNESAGALFKNKFTNFIFIGHEDRVFIDPKTFDALKNIDESQRIKLAQQIIEQQSKIEKQEAIKVGWIDLSGFIANTDPKMEFLNEFHSDSTNIFINTDDIVNSGEKITIREMLKRFAISEKAPKNFDPQAVKIIIRERDQQAFTDSMFDMKSIFHQNDLLVNKGEYYYILYSYPPFQQDKKLTNLQIDNPEEYFDAFGSMNAPTVKEYNEAFKSLANTKYRSEDVRTYTIKDPQIQDGKFSFTFIKGTGQVKGKTKINLSANQTKQQIAHRIFAYFRKMFEKVTFYDFQDGERDKFMAMFQVFRLLMDDKEVRKWVMDSIIALYQSKMYAIGRGYHTEFNKEFDFLLSLAIDNGIKEIKPIAMDCILSEGSYSKSSSTHYGSLFINFIAASSDEDYHLMFLLKSLNRFTVDHVTHLELILNHYIMEYLGVERNSLWKIDDEPTIEFFFENLRYICGLADTDDNLIFHNERLLLRISGIFSELCKNDKIAKRLLKMIREEKNFRVAQNLFQFGVQGIYIEYSTDPRLTVDYIDTAIQLFKTTPLDVAYFFNEFMTHQDREGSDKYDLRREYRRDELIDLLVKHLINIDFQDDSKSQTLQNIFSILIAYQSPVGQPSALKFLDKKSPHFVEAFKYFIEVGDPRFFEEVWKQITIMESSGLNEVKLNTIGNYLLSVLKLEGEFALTSEQRVKINSFVEKYIFNQNEKNGKILKLWISFVGELHREDKLEELRALSRKAGNKDCERTIMESLSLLSEKEAQEFLKIYVMSIWAKSDIEEKRKVYGFIKSPARQSNMQQRRALCRLLLNTAISTNDSQLLDWILTGFIDGDPNGAADLLDTGVYDNYDLSDVDLGHHWGVRYSDVYVDAPQRIRNYFVRWYMNVLMKTPALTFGKEEDNEILKMHDRIRIKLYKLLERDMGLQGERFNKLTYYQGFNAGKWQGEPEPRLETYEDFLPAVVLLKPFYDMAVNQNKFYARMTADDVFEILKSLDPYFYEAMQGNVIFQMYADFLNQQKEHQSGSIIAEAFKRFSPEIHSDLPVSTAVVDIRSLTPYVHDLYEASLDKYLNPVFFHNDGKFKKNDRNYAEHLFLSFFLRTLYLLHQKDETHALQSHIGENGETINNLRAKYDDAALLANSQEDSKYKMVFFKIGRQASQILSNGNYFVWQGPSGRVYHAPKAGEATFGASLDKYQPSLADAAMKTDLNDRGSDDLMNNTPTDSAMVQKKFPNIGLLVEVGLNPVFWVKPNENIFGEYDSKEEIYVQKVTGILQKIIRNLRQNEYRDKPLPGLDPHLLNTGNYAAQIYQLRYGRQAPAYLRIAGMLHDIDRAFPHFEVNKKDYEKALGEHYYDQYKKAHSMVSAKIAVGLLKKAGASDNLISRVYRVIVNHEAGGQEDIDMVRDADAISYFEDEGFELVLQQTLSGQRKVDAQEGVRNKTAFMYFRCSDESRQIIDDVMRNRQIRNNLDRMDPEVVTLFQNIKDDKDLQRKILNSREEANYKYYVLFYDLKGKHRFMLGIPGDVKGPVFWVMNAVSSRIESLSGQELNDQKLVMLVNTIVADLRVPEKNLEILKFLKKIKDGTPMKLPLYPHSGFNNKISYQATALLEKIEQLSAPEQRFLVQIWENSDDLRGNDLRFIISGIEAGASSMITKKSLYDPEVFYFISFWESLKFKFGKDMTADNGDSQPDLAMMQNSQLTSVDQNNPARQILIQLADQEWKQILNPGWMGKLRRAIAFLKEPITMESFAAAQLRQAINEHPQKDEIIQEIALMIHMGDIGTGNNRLLTGGKGLLDFMVQEDFKKQDLIELSRRGFLKLAGGTASAMGIMPIGIKSVMSMVENATISIPVGDKGDTQYPSSTWWKKWQLVHQLDERMNALRLHVFHINPSFHPDGIIIPQFAHLQMDSITLPNNYERVNFPRDLSYYKHLLSEGNLKIQLVADYISTMAENLEAAWDILELPSFSETDKKQMLMDLHAAKTKYFQPKTIPKIEAMITETKQKIIELKKEREIVHKWVDGFFYLNLTEEAYLSYDNEILQLEFNLQQLKFVLGAFNKSRAENWLLKLSGEKSDAAMLENSQLSIGDQNNSTREILMQLADQEWKQILNPGWMGRLRRAIAYLKEPISIESFAAANLRKTIHIHPQRDVLIQEIERMKQMRKNGTGNETLLTGGSGLIDSMIKEDLESGIERREFFKISVAAAMSVGFLPEGLKDAMKLAERPVTVAMPDQELLRLRLFTKITEHVDLVQEGITKTYNVIYGATERNDLVLEMLAGPVKDLTPKEVIEMFIRRPHADEISTIFLKKAVGDLEPANHILANFFRVLENNPSMFSTLRDLSDFTLDQKQKILLDYGHANGFLEPKTMTDLKSKISETRENIAKLNKERDIIFKWLDEFFYVTEINTKWVLNYDEKIFQLEKELKNLEFILGLFNKARVDKWPHNVSGKNHDAAMLNNPEHPQLYALEQNSLNRQILMQLAEKISSEILNPSWLKRLKMLFDHMKQPLPMKAMAAEKMRQAVENHPLKDVLRREIECMKLSGEIGAGKNGFMNGGIGLLDLMVTEDRKDQRDGKAGMSRREFMKTVAVAAAGTRMMPKELTGIMKMAGGPSSVVVDGLFQAQEKKQDLYFKIYSLVTQVEQRYSSFLWKNNLPGMQPVLVGEVRLRIPTAVYRVLTNQPLDTEEISDVLSTNDLNSFLGNYSIEYLEGLLGKLEPIRNILLQFIIEMENTPPEVLSSVMNLPISNDGKRQTLLDLFDVKTESPENEDSIPELEKNIVKIQQKIVGLNAEREIFYKWIERFFYRTKTTEDVLNAYSGEILQLENDLKQMQSVLEITKKFKKANLLQRDDIAHTMKHIIHVDRDSLDAICNKISFLTLQSFHDRRIVFHHLRSAFEFLIQVKLEVGLSEMMDFHEKLTHNIGNDRVRDESFIVQAEDIIRDIEKEILRLGKEQKDQALSHRRNDAAMLDNPAHQLLMQLADQAWEKILNPDLVTRMRMKWNAVQMKIFGGIEEPFSLTAVAVDSLKSSVLQHSQRDQIMEEIIHMIQDGKILANNNNIVNSREGLIALMIQEMTSQAKDTENEIPEAYSESRRGFLKLIGGAAGAVGLSPFGKLGQVISLVENRKTIITRGVSQEIVTKELQDKIVGEGVWLIAGYDDLLTEEPSQYTGVYRVVFQNVISILKEDPGGRRFLEKFVHFTRTSKNMESLNKLRQAIGFVHSSVGNIRDLILNNPEMVEAILNSPFSDLEKAEVLTNRNLFADDFVIAKFKSKEKKIKQKIGDLKKERDIIYKWVDEFFYATEMIRELQFSYEEEILRLERELKKNIEELLQVYRNGLAEKFRMSDFAHSEKAKGDQAQITNPAPKDGGIDLNAAHLKVDVDQEGRGFEIKTDPAMIEQLKNINGFVPVIIDVVPVTNLRMLLGL